MSALVIRGATRYAASPPGGPDGDAGETGDVLVRDGVVVEVGTVDAPTGAEVIDADGLVLLPGLVDIHTHLREPGREDAETVATGSAAAAAGGFTAILAMANTAPVADTAEVVEHVLDLGRACGLVDVQPIGAVTKGLAGAELAELGLMHRSRARVRVFSDDGHCVSDSRVMRRALEYIRAFDGVISQHSQDPALAGASACAHEGELSGRLGLPGWPAVAESTVIARDVMLAAHTGSRLHVAHVTTAEGVEVVRWAKARGIRVTAEATPHHLALTEERLIGYDPVFKVNPPLRPTEDAEALRDALVDGTIDARRDRPRAARPSRQGARLRRRGQRDARAGDLPRGRQRPHGAHRPDGLGRPRPGDVGGPGADRRARRPRPADRPRRAGEPRARRPGRTWTVDRERSKSLARNNPWHGMSLTGAVHTTILRGTVTRPGRRGAPMRDRPRAGGPRPRGRPDVPGEGVRPPRRDRGRGGLLDRA